MICPFVLSWTVIKLKIIIPPNNPNGTGFPPLPDKKGNSFVLLFYDRISRMFICWMLKLMGIKGGMVRTL